MVQVWEAGHAEASSCSGCGPWGAWQRSTGEKAVPNVAAGLSRAPRRWQSVSFGKSQEQRARAEMDSDVAHAACPEGLTPHAPTAPAALHPAPRQLVLPGPSG